MACQPSHWGVGGLTSALSLLGGSEVQGEAWGTAQHQGTHLPQQTGVGKGEALLGWGVTLWPPWLVGTVTERRIRTPWDEL